MAEPATRAAGAIAENGTHALGLLLSVLRPAVDP